MFCRKNGSSPKKFLFIFGFLLPCVAIILCYSAIFYRVRQSRWGDVNRNKYLKYEVVE